MHHTNATSSSKYNFYIRSNKPLIHQSPPLSVVVTGCCNTDNNLQIETTHNNLSSITEKIRTNNNNMPLSLDELADKNTNLTLNKI